MFQHGPKEMATAFKTLQIPLLQAEPHGLKSLLLALMCQGALWVTKHFEQIIGDGRRLTVILKITKFFTILGQQSSEPCSLLISLRSFFKKALCGHISGFMDQLKGPIRIYCSGGVC